MPWPRRELVDSIGAKASIVTRFLHPKEAYGAVDKKHRSEVVILGKEDLVVNKKMQLCFVCTKDGVDAELHAVAKHFKIEEEGNVDGFFEGIEGGDKEASSFQELKIKWKKSEAKKILYKLILDGVVSDEAEDSTMSLLDIYNLEEEFSKYDYAKFLSHLSSLQKRFTISTLMPKKMLGSLQ